MNLRLDWCSHKAAKWAVENWHYSQCIPAGKLLKIGVWEKGKFIGVVIFSRGANNNLGKEFGLTFTQCCELTRVALKNHESPVSKIVAVAIRLLKKKNPNLQIVYSYADPRQGHVGGIYQAMNWIYLGMPKQSKGAHYIVNGKEMHGRSVRSKWGCEKNIPFKWEYAVNTEKHKYIFLLKGKIRSEIEGLAKSYPKRAGSIETDAATLPGGRGRCESDLGAPILEARKCG